MSVFGLRTAGGAALWCRAGPTRPACSYAPLRVAWVCRLVVVVVVVVGVLGLRDPAALCGVGRCCFSALGWADGAGLRLHPPHFSSPAPPSFPFVALVLRNLCTPFPSGCQALCTPRSPLHTKV